MNYQNVQQEHTTHNSLYTLDNYELQLNSDPEDPNGTDNWKSTNSHNSELGIAYNNKAGNNTLHTKMFYALYIKPNGDNNGVYNLSLDQIVVTMKYQLVPVPKDLIKSMNKTDSSNNKIRIDHFDIKQSIVRDDYSNNNKCDNQTPNNNKDNSEDGDTDELDNSQHLDGLILDKIIDHEEQVILTKESFKSTSVSVMGLTNIDTSLPSLFLRCLYKL